jgi:hypothetical protein
MYEGNLVFTCDDGTVHIPGKFVTDEASVPRIFWSVPGYGPDDWLEAAILHDWNYVQHKVDPTFVMTRKEADDLLYDGIISSGFSRFTAFTAWAFVRLFGAGVWAGTTKLKRERPYPIRKS